MGLGIGGVALLTSSSLEYLIGFKVGCRRCIAVEEGRRQAGISRIRPSSSDKPLRPARAKEAVGRRPIAAARGRGASSGFAPSWGGGGRLSACACRPPSVGRERWRGEDLGRTREGREAGWGCELGLGRAVWAVRVWSGEAHKGVSVVL